MEAVPDPHHFEFDLDLGIRTQVVEKLETSPALPLGRGAGPLSSGIYALYLKGVLVYIGKVSRGMTKSRRTLRARLNDHVGKIEGRDNIFLTDMQYRYLTFSSEWWVWGGRVCTDCPLPAGVECELCLAVKRRVRDDREPTESAPGMRSIPRKPSPNVRRTCHYDR